MQMDGTWPSRREGTVHHRKISVSTEAHKALAVLRVAGIGQSLPAIFNSISEAMEILRVGHGSGNHFRVSDRKGPIGHLFKMNREGCVHETWQSGKERSEESLRAARADHRERGPSSSLVFREDHRIEEVGDEIGKVIGVVVGEKNVRNSMPVYPGLEEIRQCPWTKVQQYCVVGADKIARSSSCRVDVCAGAENGQPHSPKRQRSRPRLSSGLASLI